MCCKVWNCCGGFDGWCKGWNGGGVLLVFWFCVVD